MRLLFFFAFFLFSRSVFTDLAIEYDERDRVTKLELGKSGYVEYHYDENYLLEITRHTEKGGLVYTHAYDYNCPDHPIKEKVIGNLGEITYTASEGCDGLTLYTTSPFHSEECYYNSTYQLLTRIQDQNAQEYSYDEKNKLVHESHYQDSSYELDDFGRVVSQTIDGEITQYEYNESNQLISTITPTLTVNYTYGDRGERLSKTIIKDNKEITEKYFSIGKENIGVIRDDTVIYLQVPGLSFHKDLMRPIAIETKDSVYAPIHNNIGHISHLINIDTREEKSYLHDPYGQNLASESFIVPWLFAGKYYDVETDLICYGDRYYSPSLKIWLTPDKIEDPNREHPLQYCLDNPVFYCDPDGNFQVNILRFTFGAAGCILSCPLLGPSALMIAGGALVGYGTGKLINHYQEKHRIKEYHKQLDRKKAGSIDPTLPENPFEDSTLEDISHPKAKSKGHHTFKDKKTGNKIRFDEGKPGETGHEGHDHYHRINPKSKGDADAYLDSKGNPIGKNSDASHLYHPKKVWWK